MFLHIFLLQRYIQSFSNGFDEGFKNVKVLFMQSGKAESPTYLTTIVTIIITTTITTILDLEFSIITQFISHKLDYVD